MQARVDVTARQYHVPEELEDKIRQKIAKLERLEPRIDRCHVMVEGSGRHHPQGPVSLTVEVIIPSRGSIVSGGKGYDFGSVVRDVFKAIERRLADHAGIPFGGWTRR